MPVDGGKRSAMHTGQALQVWLDYGRGEPTSVMVDYERDNLRLSQS
jgi:hypothetical protein